MTSLFNVRRDRQSFQLKTEGNLEKKVKNSSLIYRHDVGTCSVLTVEQPAATILFVWDTMKRLPPLRRLASSESSQVSPEY